MKVSQSPIMLIVPKMLTPKFTIVGLPSFILSVMYIVGTINQQD